MPLVLQHFRVGLIWVCAAVTSGCLFRILLSFADHLRVGMQAWIIA